MSHRCLPNIITATHHSSDHSSYSTTTTTNHIFGIVTTPPCATEPFCHTDYSVSHLYFFLVFPSAAAVPALIALVALALGGGCVTTGVAARLSPGLTVRGVVARFTPKLGACGELQHDGGHRRENGETEGDAWRVEVVPLPAVPIVRGDGEPPSGCRGDGNRAVEPTGAFAVDVFPPSAASCRITLAGTGCSNAAAAFRGVVARPVLAAGDAVQLPPVPLTALDVAPVHPRVVVGDGQRLRMVTFGDDAGDTRPLAVTLTAVARALGDAVRLVVGLDAADVVTGPLRDGAAENAGDPLRLRLVVRLPDGDCDAAVRTGGTLAGGVTLRSRPAADNTAVVV